MSPLSRRAFLGAAAGALFASPSAAVAEEAKVDVQETIRKGLEWLAQDYVEHLKHHLNQIVSKRFSTTYLPEE